MSKISLPYVVLFVEGETEKEFYTALINHYKIVSVVGLRSSKIFNVKGIGKFESSVVSKLRQEIIPNHDADQINVVCCYDADVFELGQKPPTNWIALRKRVNDLGIKNFVEVKSVRTIEDWFLKDIDGLCKYLKMTVPRKNEGKNGLQKIKGLFKRGKTPKIYQKGHYSHKFMDSLDLDKIRLAVKSELALLETALNVKMPQPKNDGKMKKK